MSWWPIIAVSFRRVLPLTYSFPCSYLDRDASGLGWSWAHRWCNGLQSPVTAFVLDKDEGDSHLHDHSLWSQHSGLDYKLAVAMMDALDAFRKSALAISSQLPPEWYIRSVVPVESVLRVAPRRVEDHGPLKSGLGPLDYEIIPDTPVENGSDVED
jgi:hypothetical protein